MPRTVKKIPATINRETLIPIGSMTKRKVAAYARVSTDSEEQLTSYEAQVDYYTHYIKERDDWEFAGIYSDEGITGTCLAKRDGFNRMVADALEGKIDLIVTKSVSRFARNTVDSLTTIRKLKENGTEVFFEKENIWTFDSKGEMLLTILSSLSQEESRSISENVKWGHRKKFSDGRFSMPYSHFLGYDKGPNGSLVINEDEAKIVRRIYSDFITGLSPYAIAKQLTNEGIPTPFGKKKWLHGTVRSILQNEKYKGCALLQKNYTPDFLTKKPVKNDGTVPQYYVDESHPAIIPPDQFDLVQDILGERSRDPKHSGTTIFSGKIRCGECGGLYGTKVWHSNDKYRRVVWQCTDKYNRKTYCKTPYLTEDEIKSAFVQVVNRIFKDREFLLTELHELLNLLSDTTSLEEESKMLGEQMDLTAKAAGEIAEQKSALEQNQDEYDRLLRSYEETQKKRDEVIARLENTNDRRIRIEKFIHTVEELPELFTDFDVSIWAAMVDSVTVYSKQKIVFHLTCGKNVKGRIG